MGRSGQRMVGELGQLWHVRMPVNKCWYFTFHHSTRRFKIPCVWQKFKPLWCTRPWWMSFLVNAEATHVLRLKLNLCCLVFQGSARNYHISSGFTEVNSFWMFCRLSWNWDIWDKVQINPGYAHWKPPAVFIIALRRIQTYLLHHQVS